MSIKYKTIGDKEKNKTLASFIKAQEADHMSFVLNKERFEKIIETAEDGQLKEKCIKELPVIKQRIKEVENILENTYAQITDEDLETAIVEVEADLKASAQKE